MPEAPLTPKRRTLSEETGFAPNPPSAFVELGLVSCFSFLRGASEAVDLTATASRLGYDAIGIADWNTMAGVVRFHTEAGTARIRPIIGARVVLADGAAFLAYPADRAAYGRLCRLLSKGKMADLDGDWQQKGVCDLTLDDLAAHQEGIVLIALPGDDLDQFAARLPAFARVLPAMTHIAASYLYRGDDRARIARLDRLARTHGRTIVATNDVHYHAPERRPLQDVMTCIREKTRIEEAGFLLHANAERHLKSPQAMIALFADWPDAIAESRKIAERCTFSLEELRYEYPRETVPGGRTPQQWLEELTERGARWRYREGVPDKVRAQIDHELRLIEKLDIARYFLTVRDVVEFARGLDPPILCQGRGSAANSAVCYVLGITAVDPSVHDLLFERFVSEERKEPPDIDVDFEHERREEVIQHIYEKYGRERAGLCATVIHYRPRSAVREVGKVMGLSEDVTSAMARTIWGSWGEGVDDAKLREAGLDPDDAMLRRVVTLTDQLIGLPRHLSQHVGGFVLTENPLVETVPVGNGAMADRSFIEWDKDDIDALGILKIDVLALGMLTCIRKCFELIGAHYGRELTLASLEPTDEKVYDMLCRGDSVGVFQVESRAQMNMLPRLRPRCFYDLVIEVAIVRPGPIQGDMVHPYLRRRSGAQDVFYPSPTPEHGPPDELERILKRTLGVPIFQEQAMKIAMVAARFSPLEANKLRKAMATFRSRGQMSDHKEKMVGRMVERGYDPEFAARCFSQIEGFGEYGFPESHAASFALLVYVSSWIKCHYPDVFACGLLNSQPMGFYAPAQIVRDAREHGVEVRPPDVNFSQWDNTLEPVGPRRHALRLGFRQVDGLARAEADRLVAAREAPYADIADLRARSHMGVGAIGKLAAADAFRSMGLDRRQALWDARALKPAPDLPLFAAARVRDEGAEAPGMLPTMPVSEHVVADYQTLRLSLKAHPLSFLREGLTKKRFIAAHTLASCRNGQSVAMAGLVLVRQRPGSARGVCFITIEDETGVANLVVWPKVMARFRPVIMGARLMAVRGPIQKDTQSGVIHVVARHLEDRTADLAQLSREAFTSDYARADEVIKPIPSRGERHPRDVRVIPKSRDFH
ncbi:MULTISPECIES: error-prone DNA polymerase [unclassified Roseitalea]|uniref:error-prone DNA polymerase n=1 Tax=unclassified Roseitalea TaxID=2639107 RepID=UPI00273F02CC|nr:MULTISPECIES: error-prone DNA polymerase [unclassified Roseitalea]